MSLCFSKYFNVATNLSLRTQLLHKNSLLQNKIFKYCVDPTESENPNANKITLGFIVYRFHTLTT